MKNEELFDMLTELKVDDEYIDEALTGNSDSRGIKVYAGKTRPMKIVAPIAACLAVFAAAGILFANRDKLPMINGAMSASSGESSLTDEEKLDQVLEDFKNRPRFAYYGIYPSHPTLVEEMVDSCKSFIVDGHAEALTGDVTWQIKEMDFDLKKNIIDYEFLLCPQINGKSVKGVGAYVFRRSDTGQVEWLGSFGSEFDSIDLDNLYLFRDNDTVYYYNCSEEYERCIDSVHKLYIDENAGIREESYLQLVKTYPNDASSDTPYTETAYRYGEEISTKELLSEWASNLNSNTHDGVLPTPNKPTDAHLEAAECVQLLIDKYDIPADVNSLHRSVQYFDINNNGIDETVIEIRNCEQLRGIYVFSSDCKLIGEFDLDDEVMPELSENDLILEHERYTSLRKRTEKGEKHYYYCTFYTRCRKNELGYIDVIVWRTHEITVNEDGSLSTKTVLETGGNIDNTSQSIKRVNGIDVPLKEYSIEEQKYDVRFDVPFVW